MTLHLSSGLYAEFFRLSLIVGNDLNASQRAHHECVTDASTDIEASILRLLSSPFLCTHSHELRAAVYKFKRTTAMKVLMPLVHLDNTRDDTEKFLLLCLQEVSAKRKS